MVGLGLPPIRHWTTRAPVPGGRVALGYALGPRVVNLVLHSRGATGRICTPRRGRLAALLSPMNGPHVLRLTTPDLKKYELHNVWVTAGYECPPRTSARPGGRARRCSSRPTTHLEMGQRPLGAGEDAGRQRADVHGPWRRSRPETELVLGFTGPFLLGTVVYTATLACVNDGSWAVRPTVTVSGPLSDWSLTNATTGKAMTGTATTSAPGRP